MARCAARYVLPHAAAAAAAAYPSCDGPCRHRPAACAAPAVPRRASTAHAHPAAGDTDTGTGTEADDGTVPADTVAVAVQDRTVPAEGEGPEAEGTVPTGTAPAAVAANGDSRPAATAAAVGHGYSAAPEASPGGGPVMVGAPAAVAAEVVAADSLPNDRTTERPNDQTTERARERVSDTPNRNNEQRTTNNESRRRTLHAAPCTVSYTGHEPSPHTNPVRNSHHGLTTDH